MFAKKTVDFGDLQQKLLDYIIDKTCLQYNEQMIRTSFGVLANTERGKKIIAGPDGAAKFSMSVLYLLKNAPNFAVTSAANLMKFMEENPKLAEKIKDGAFYAGEFHDGVVSILRKSAPAEGPSPETLRQWMSQMSPVDIGLYQSKAKDIAEIHDAERKDDGLSLDYSEIASSQPNIAPKPNR